METYQQARKHFNSVKPWRNRTDRPIAGRRHNAKRMRMLDDGTIVYQHWAKDILLFHPNGNITVNGYSSCTTTSLLNFLLPRGVRHEMGVCGDPVIILYDRNGSPYGRWEQGTVPDKNGYCRYVRVRDASVPEVIKCGTGVTLKFNKATYRWRPTTKVVPFEYRTLSKRARALAKDLNITEFKCVQSAIIAMAPPERTNRWGCGDHGKIADMLLAKDYAGVLDEGELYWRYNGYGKTPQHTLLGVKQSCLNKVRDRYCVLKGATTKHVKRSLTLPQYSTYKANRRRFG